MKKFISILLIMITIIINLYSCNNEPLTSETQNISSESISNETTSEVTNMKEEEFFDINKTTYPSPESIKLLKNGMQYKEVIEILGKPQRYGETSGLISFEWDLSDGSKVSFMFFLSNEINNGNGNLENYLNYSFIFISE